MYVLQNVHITSASKKYGQTAVLYHYCGLFKFFFETDVIFWKLLLFSYFICEEKRTEKTGRKYVEYYSMVSIISPGCLIDTF